MKKFLCSFSIDDQVFTKGINILIIPLFLKFFGYEIDDISSMRSYNLHDFKGKSWKGTHVTKVLRCSMEEDLPNYLAGKHKVYKVFAFRSIKSPSVFHLV